VTYCVSHGEFVLLCGVAGLLTSTLQASIITDNHFVAAGAAPRRQARTLLADVRQPMHRRSMPHQEPDKSHRRVEFNSSVSLVWFLMRNTLLHESIAGVCGSQVERGREIYITSVLGGERVSRHGCTRTCTYCTTSQYVVCEIRLTFYEYVYMFGIPRHLHETLPTWPASQPAILYCKQ
jgi:hypothetical protein